MFYNDDIYVQREREREREIEREREREREKFLVLLDTVSENFILQKKTIWVCTLIYIETVLVRSVTRHTLP